CRRPPTACPAIPKSARTTPITSRMTPIVQRIGTPATNPMTSRMIPRIIMRHLVSGRTDPEDRLDRRCAEAAWRGWLRLPLIYRLGAGLGGRPDIRRTAREASGACPRRPEHHGQHDAKGAGAHKDPSDGADVDGAVGGVDVDGEGEYCAYRQQEDADSESHDRYLRALWSGSFDHRPSQLIALQPFTCRSWSFQCPMSPPGVIASSPRMGPSIWVSPSPRRARAGGAFRIAKVGGQRGIPQGPRHG